MKVAIHTLGCKLNQAESELMARKFAEAGHSIVSGEGADVYILNTCTVTHIADRKSRHLIRLWRSRNPQALIVATGCYAERASQELMRAGAGLVIGNEDKMHLLEFLEVEPAPVRCPAGKLVQHDLGRVRSFIKIQDGCNDSCAYCVVPQVRGRENCLPAADVVNEVMSRVSAGYKEIVFTGTKIGSYRYNDVNLKELVEQVLATTGIERLHLSSLQPQDISPELLSLWQDPRLCQHFHLALQSGSDSVLRRMRRHYSVDDYKQTVSLIRKTVPRVAITIDVMVGFPGESVEEFEESYRFCKEIDFANIHVFTYSSRPGTLSSRMPGQVSDKLKKERSQRMLQLAKESAKRFCQRFLGRELIALWENELEPNGEIYSGLSDNYIRVFTQSSERLTNQFCRVLPTRLHGEGLWVEVKGED
ncbi:MAG: tRNA (N(6)-L-threonylcarbamoyladenosine(37)-C(2))-methylthiotransferase MtaB [Dehalococcoidia bacterium]|nr:tRNA (N(6)-L-threonylcarbamoyladenosine(37)-C(2))-methylthiotransferase MtaB [Dehalococcoidia bacterium]